MKSNYYKGIRSLEGCGVTTDKGPLHGCQNILNHSPDGFEWGYSGAGPSQLALAILFDAVGRAAAIRFHCQFRDEVLADITADEFFLTRQEVLTKVASLLSRSTSYNGSQLEH